MSSTHDVQDATGIVARHTPHGSIIVSGTTTPTDGDGGYAPGCIFINVSTGVVTSNQGSITSANFDVMTIT